MLGCAALLIFGFVIALARPMKVAEYGARRLTPLFHDRLEGILTGPLALRENSRSPLSLFLEQTLVLLSQTTRPGMAVEQRGYSIGIRGVEGLRTVKEGEEFYLSLTQNAVGEVDAIAFSEGPANLSMKAQPIEKNALLLKLTTDTGVEEEVILPSAQSSLGLGAHLPATVSLKEAKCYGVDRFFEYYGGFEYRPLSQKQKLELFDDNGSYFLFVGAGDFLTFHEGRWQPINSFEWANPLTPLAQVLSASSGQLVIEIWDEKGFSLLQTRVGLANLSPLYVRSDQLITAPKLRSAKQVSCHMGKRRFILREGDWIIKTQKGWHKLTAMDEIVSYLWHATRGELFVVDSIDAGSGLKGHYFDEMRSQVQPLTISLANTAGKATPNMRHR